VALLEALPEWIAGRITPQPQDESRASHTRMLKKEDGLIVWERAASILARQVRAYTPWPSSYTYWRGKLLKIIAAHPLKVEVDSSIAVGAVTTREEAGQRVIAIVTGSGLLIVKHLQLEGKKATNAAEFLRGYPQVVGEVLG
jgi:methionyl-tRNA formyltransferase